MIGILFVAHETFGSGMLGAAERVVGKMAQARSLQIMPDDNMEEKRKEIERAIGELNSGEGVIVLTDLFGGSPSNLAMSCLRPGSVELVAGVNLPMIIRAADVRKQELPLIDAARQISNAGKSYITVASDFLSTPTPSEPVEVEALRQHNKSLKKIEGEFARLAKEVAWVRQSYLENPGLGHNNPPPDLSEAETRFRDAEIAARLIPVSTTNDSKSTDVLRLCKNVLEKAFSTISSLCQWLKDTTKTFVHEAAKSSGKYFGLSILTVATLASLQKSLEPILSALGSLIP